VVRHQLLFTGVGALLIVLGIPLAYRRVRPNAFYGLRIPATFADERVWYEANALTGRDITVVGAVLIAVALGLPHVLRLPPEGYVGICTAVLLGGTLGSTIRAWRLANRLWRERSTHKS